MIDIASSEKHENYYIYNTWVIRRENNDSPYVYTATLIFDQGEVVVLKLREEVKTGFPVRVNLVLRGEGHKEFLFDDSPYASIEATLSYIQETLEGTLVQKALRELLELRETGKKVN